MSTSHSTLNERRKAKSSPKRAFLMWLGYEDSNLGMPESESGALPLGDTPTGCTYKVSVLNKLAGVRGFEPRNAGIRIRCLTAWRYPIRTTLSGEWCGRRDLNSHTLRRQNLNLVRLPISPLPQKKDGGYDGIRTCDPIIMSDVL